MIMKRREFSSTLLAAGALAGSAVLTISGSARAQGSPVEGTNYVRLSQPVPITVPAGKIEVIEFFWYGCPHCNAFEPTLEPWIKRLPNDVTFRRVPVAFRPAYAPHQRIYYALEALGLLDNMHRKVFYAIHSDRMQLEQRDEISRFMTKNGVDAVKFMAAFDSFSVQTKSRQANDLAAAYKIDGVPAIGIQGRFYTSGSLAGSNDKALAVTDFLIQRVRKPA